MHRRAIFSALLVWALFALACPGSAQEGGKTVIERVCPELPNLQCPISLIIDDPTPIFSNRISKEGLDQRKKSGKGVDWWTFFDDLIEIFETYDMKGKFTLNPYRSDVGMVDMVTDPARKKQLDHFLSVLKKRIVPDFDITPEIISHGPVIDIKTGKPLGIDKPEHEWSRTQDEDTLEAYIGRGLTALKNVGLHCNGVTSPSDFGRGNEANYVRAISRALKRVNDVDLAWYFLHSDAAAYNTPRLMLLDRAEGRAVVSIVATSHVGDIRLTKKFGADVAKRADVLITKDGKKGVFPQMIAARSYIVFYRHWGLLYDKGNETGIKVLRIVFDRMREHYADDVQWMTCSDIARYYAVTRTCRTTYSHSGDSATMRFESPFACKDYTLSCNVSRTVREIRVQGEGKILARLDKRPKRLPSHSWFMENGLVFVCLDLGSDTRVKLQFEPE